MDQRVAEHVAEDLGPEGDLTAALVPETVTAHYALRARTQGVLAGRAPADEAFRRVGPELELVWHAGDGDELKPGDTILDVSGPLRPILTAGARIVSTASAAHTVGRLDFDHLQAERGYSSFAVYGTSKLCNILWTRELARRLLTEPPASILDAWEML